MGTRGDDAREIVRAHNCHDDVVAALRDVSLLLPVAGRLHPKDLHALQTRVCAALAKASGTDPEYQPIDAAGHPVTP